MNEGNSRPVLWSDRRGRLVKPSWMPQEQEDKFARELEETHEEWDYSHNHVEVNWRSVASYVVGFLLLVSVVFVLVVIWNLPFLGAFLFTGLPAAVLVGIVAKVALS